jgi:hypothetical protein
MSPSLFVPHGDAARAKAILIPESQCWGSECWNVFSVHG